MDTDTIFTRHEPIMEKILFVLSLDRKKMKEHILVGEEDNIRKHLLGMPSTKIFLNITRPLGTLIIELEHDSNNNWYNVGLRPLYDALHTNRWVQPGLEQTSSFFLKKKFHSGNPVSMYAAFRIWNDYLIARLPRERDAASKTFISQAVHLIQAFTDQILIEDNPNIPASSSFSFTSIPSASIKDVRLELWYPGYARPFECVSAYDSFRPLITYYFNRLNEWNLCFRICKVCGHHFLAQNHRYDLCSEKCRKQQALENKRAFDQRAKMNTYDHLYKNESQNWRNHINRAKKNPLFTPEQIADMEEAFSSFRKEALQKKKLVKEKKLSIAEFSDWLYAQNSIISKLSMP